MSRLPRSLLLIAATVLSTSTAFPEASIEGKITLPKPRVPVANRRYSMSSKGGMAQVSPTPAIIYLEGNFPAPTSAPTAQIVQKGIAFVPSVLPVQVGTRVEFPNQDDVEHSVYTTSSPSFNLGRVEPRQQPAPSRVFDKPGIYTIRCDIHEGMRADILVLNTPYFVVTDAEGRYRLTGLPAGHYVLKSWIDGKSNERPVDLTDGAVATANFP
jgi:plastocyanin